MYDTYEIPYHAHWEALKSAVVLPHQVSVHEQSPEATARWEIQGILKWKQH